MTTATTMNIRRNKDGQQNLRDLRACLETLSNKKVDRFGGNWIIATDIGNCWHETPAPYYYTERQAIQKALFGEIESEAEVSYHAGR